MRIIVQHADEFTLLDQVLSFKVSWNLGICFLIIHNRLKFKKIRIDMCRQSQIYNLVHFFFQCSFIQCTYERFSPKGIWSGGNRKSISLPLPLTVKPFKPVIPFPFLSNKRIGKLFHPVMGKPKNGQSALEAIKIDLIIPKIPFSPDNSNKVMLMWANYPSIQYSSLDSPKCN